MVLHRPVELAGILGNWPFEDRATLLLYRYSAVTVAALNTTGL
jgi:hypothetical protein